MKALVYEGPRVMNIRQMEVPLPGEGEVLIKVGRAGICGSELSGYLGHNSLRKPPLVMGHEFSGTVERLGEDAVHFSEGDRVTANPLVSCGDCRYCTTGRAQLCPSRKLIGAATPGAFAEYVVVPEKNVYRIPDTLSMDEAALTEPFACAVHVCRLLGLEPAEKLLIYGAGPIGLLVLKVAEILGLTGTAVIDVNEERLEIARTLGAVTATDVGRLPAPVVEEGFDAAVDAVGLGITRQKSMASVRLGGRVAFTGLHEAESTLPINTAIRNEISTVGGFAYSRLDFEQALQWIGEGKADIGKWTMHAPLEDGRECFEKLINGPGNVAKILLTL